MPPDVPILDAAKELARDAEPEPCDAPSCDDGANDESCGDAPEAVKNAAPWLNVAARVGYAAKGATYLLVGSIGVLTALHGGAEKGARGSIRAILDEPLGKPAVAAIGVGLLCYVAWQGLRAVFDPEGEGPGLKGWRKRATFAVSFGAHLMLGLFCFNLLLGPFNFGYAGRPVEWEAPDEPDDYLEPPEESLPQTVGARVMGWPGGWVLVVAVGLAVLGFGLGQLYKAAVTDLCDVLDVGRLGTGWQRAILAVSRVGVGARGVAFGLAGAYVVWGGWQTAAHHLGGLGRGLRALGDFGPWALGVVAVGLANYGLFMLAKAAFRRIHIDDEPA